MRAYRLYGWERIAEEEIFPKRFGAVSGGLLRFFIPLSDLFENSCKILLRMSCIWVKGGEPVWMMK